MRENENIRIRGHKIVLTPYEAFHVPKYHGWMESETLREETASERLTLENEYEMQSKWRLDPDKCTFIILDKAIFDAKCKDEKMPKGQEIDAMVGDVNIFYYDENEGCKTGEIEIMIAEPQARRKGMGREAVCSIMRYGQSVLGTEKFISKIGFKNGASINLFQTLGFKEVSRSEAFQEITLSLDATNPNIFLPWTKDYAVETIK